MMTEYDDENDELNDVGSMRWVAGDGGDGAADRQHDDDEAGGMSPELSNWLQANIAADEAKRQRREHNWVVIGHSTGPRPVMFLQCADCGEGNLLFPTADEWADYLQELAEAGMSWVARHFGQPDPFAAPSAAEYRAVDADGWPVRESDFADEFKFLFDAGAPTDCAHEWIMGGTIHRVDMEGEALIAVHCDHCHNTGYVLDPTSDEIGQAEYIEDKGGKAIWHDAHRVVMAADYRARLEAMSQLPVAFLVNALDLFEADDDIPF